MKYLFFSLLFATGAQALTIKPGTYESDRCFVEITKTSEKGIYVEIASKQNDNSLQREIIVVDESGKLTDGPGLCFDEVTMGSSIGVKEVASVSNGNTISTIGCGGAAFPIELSATITTNSAKELIAFSEVSATRQLLFKKKRSMDCGKLKLIK